MGRSLGGRLLTAEQWELLRHRIWLERMEEGYITPCRAPLFKKVFGERKKSMSRINKPAKSPDLDDPGFIFTL
ncbi:hypothetical protein HMPREF0201_00667 [Cedecea davisae DSM 4568]|uniref:Uncharacterized protein n=1 Tax=Cedecea davisae DSM 4568 TaxID=566551 RepID=S3J2G1_9ENTR|nr:hypothetical protein HMPREF0201_00667 [Cedecea davisae DSM 4568]